MAALSLAEVVAALSLAVDLGLGQPMEHLLRSCLIGLRLADGAGLGEDERAVVYYVALLGWVGCHADAHEQTAWFGDDIALKAGRFTVDLVGAAKARFALGHLGAGAPPLHRARLLGSLLVSRSERAIAFEATHCRITGHVALGLGLGSDVRDALQQLFERWDAKERPAGVRGERIALATRLVQLASVAEFHRRLGGVEAAIEVARRRRGTQFDPELVDRFCASAAEILADLDATTTWDQVISAEPALRPWLPAERLDETLEATAELADLKSPYMTAHSRGVAELARPRGGRASRRPRRRSFAAPRCCTTSVGWGSRTRSGTSLVRSPRPSSSACGCIPTSPGACSRGRPASRTSASWHPSTRSGSTARATRAASAPARSLPRPGCSAPPTSTRR